jgi:general secretion pathway protein K
VRTRRGDDRGVALLITLMILVLIVSLVWEVFRLGARAAQTGAYGRDSIRAELAAEAGIAAARIALREDADDNEYDTLDEIWSRPAPPIELGEGTIRIVVEDEERKINLNRLVLPNGYAPDDQRLAVFRRLLEILETEPSLADAIVDWLDNDDTPRVGGAESGFYLSQKFSYQAKNDFFDTVDELRLVRGITPEVFDTLRPFVTVYSAPPERTPRKKERSPRQWPTRSSSTGRRSPSRKLRRSGTSAHPFPTCTRRPDFGTSWKSGQTRSTSALPGRSPARSGRSTASGSGPESLYIGDTGE